MNLDFGTKVTITGRYVRRMDERRRYWKLIECCLDGIVIGKRTLYNGTVYTYSRYGEVDDFGGYSEFSRGDKVEAYLVAIRKGNPAYVPVECISVIVHSHTDDFLDIRE